VTTKKDIFKGGPSDRYIGGGLIDTEPFFQRIPMLENQIKNQEIWFCSAPFQMFYTSVNGNFAPCSWALDSEEGTPNITDGTSIEDYFIHDETLNAMRDEMTTPGSDLKTCKKMCQSCMKQEKEYGRSRRQASLKVQTNDPILWPRIRESVSRFKTSSKGRIINRSFEMQIKAFGNQCNLDCYMCLPFDSSTRLKTMKSSEMKDQKVFDEYMIVDPSIKKDQRALNRVVDEIADLAPYIYNLKLIGGEPLVMKRFYTVLDKIVETGHASEIMVKYQTNLASFDIARAEKLMDLIPKFKLFEFTVSLDGVGQYNDYIRRRSKWEDIQNNINIVLEYPNVQLNVNGTISFLSVLRFYKLIDWFKENENKLWQVNWSNIRGPAKLCANVLPYELKQELIPKYEGFPDIQNVLRESNNGIDYQDTIQYLLMIDEMYKGTQWDYRLFEVYPELKDFYVKPDLHLKLAKQGLLDNE
jgi:hypothetical protein